MAYLIDGNNVMGQTVGWHRDKPKARRRLLEQLATFARVKKARLSVVFDGSPDDQFPDACGFRGIRVFYAERGSDADTRIEKLVEAAKDRRGLTVVTSDRQLAFKVRARGVNTMRSGDFRRLLEDSCQRQPSTEDGENPEIDDVNAWLRYFGALPEDED